MTFPTRIRPSLLAAGLALALATGCAVNHSDNFVSLVMTQEVGPAPAPLGNVEVRVLDGRFGEITTKGKSVPGLEMVANRQVATLLPALRTQLPAVLRRNGIPAQAGRPDTPSDADQIITVRPQMAREQFDNGYSVQNGNWVGVQFAIEIRQRAGALVWRGTALERATPARSDSMAWSDAMAEDLARTLLVRLRKEGVARFGAGGDADPV
ncbi:MAG: hypothetical protein JF586_10455 [Burkholderiales bacterium]|nr:hypothetical protein [Burkholderiales bacterium]